MNDEKMDTFDSNPQNATGSDPLSQTDAPIASQKAESELAISDEEQDTTASLAFCESPVEADALSADPDPHSDLDPSPDPATDPEARIEQLRGDLMRLREELAARDSFWKRLGGECDEFRTLFPTTPLQELPDSVWQDVKRGIPLAAAYALAEKRRSYTEALAMQSNEQNRQRTSGAINGGENEYYSPTEVRAMSQEQVRANYQKIMRSMQKWH